MIVCICQNISDTTIKSAISAGALSVGSVQSQTGAATCCGKCTTKVERLIQQHAHTATPTSESRPKTIFTLNNHTANAA